MSDTIFLLVKVRIKTSHKLIHDAITELQTCTNISVTSTRHVEVLETKIIPFNLKK